MLWQSGETVSVQHCQSRTNRTRDIRRIRIRLALGQRLVNGRVPEAFGDLEHVLLPHGCASEALTLRSLIDIFWGSDGAPCVWLLVLKLSTWMFNLRRKLQPGLQLGQLGFVPIRGPFSHVGSHGPTTWTGESGGSVVVFAEPSQLVISDLDELGALWVFAWSQSVGCE